MDEAFFMQLYLDEDVDFLIVELRRARGIKVTTTQDSGQSGETVETQSAPQESAYHTRIMVTR